MFQVYEGTTMSFNGRIALFDLDGTLITSKSGRKWAQNETDWIWLTQSVPSQLDEYFRAGWTVALITNQSEWDRSMAPRNKIESVLHILESSNGWRPWCMVATAPTKAKDKKYRKPGRGLYDEFLSILKISASDVKQLQMCGDAYGDDSWSDTDIGFATAIGATFIRPYEVFRMPTPTPSSTQELVLLMGNPGSGKSTTGRRFASEYGYIHIEQDIVGSKTKTLKSVKDAIPSGRSIIIDATHGSKTNRDPYYTLAKEHTIPLRILWHVRDGRQFNAHRPKPVPEVAYAVYSKYFVDPCNDTDIIIDYA